MLTILKTKYDAKRGNETKWKAPIRRTLARNYETTDGLKAFIVNIVHIFDVNPRGCEARPNNYMEDDRDRTTAVSMMMYI